jgi:DNA-binding IclR family transcriptional regulator
MTGNNVEISLSVEKSLKVLTQLCKSPFEYKITELAKLTKINRTTLYRILNTFENDGFITKSQDMKSYKLGPKIYEMGSIYLSNFKYGDNIFLILDKISHISKESVGFAIRDNEKVISLYEIEIDQPLKMNYKQGIIYPMNRGCYGKCLMAYYDKSRVKEMLDEQHFEKISSSTLVNTDEILKEYEKIREQEFVTSIDEVSPHIVGVGIPIFNSLGDVKACVSISFFKTDRFKEKIIELKNILYEYKDEISKYMI